MVIAFSGWIYHWGAVATPAKHHHKYSGTYDYDYSGTYDYDYSDSDTR
jgi:hypothetical protein